MSITLQYETTGQTDLVAKLYLNTASAAIAAFPLAETLPGLYVATPTGLPTTPARYIVGYEKAAASLKIYSTYSWDGTAEITPASLNSAIAAVSAPTASAVSSAVWAETTRSLTDKVNFGLSAAERTSLGTSVWATTTRALTDKISFGLSTAERTSIGTSVWATTTRTLSSYGTLANDAAAAVWASATRSLTDKAEFALSTVSVTAIVSAVWGAASRQLTGFGTLAADVWTSATRGLTLPVTTDAASRTAITDALTPLSTAIDGVDFDLALLASRATEARLVNLETVARTATAATYKATIPADLATTTNLAVTNNAIAAIPTTNTLVAITNATTSAKDEILSAGSGWVTGNTIAPNNAGIAALTALLTGDSTAFTATALQFAPTGSGGGGALTTTQAEKLAAIPSDNALSAITAALNSVRDNILAAGIGWETGNNIAPNNDGIAAILARATEARLSKLDQALSTFNPVSQSISLDRVNGSAVQLAEFRATIPADLVTTAELSTALVSTNNAIASVNTAVSQLPAPNNAASDLVVDGAFTIAALANAPAGGGGGGSLTVGQDATLTAILNQATSDQVRDGDLYYRYKEGTNEEILKKKRSVIGTRIELIEEV